MPEPVKLSLENAIAVVTLNRPDVRNAIDDAMRAELVVVLEQVSNDPQVRAVVITGEGRRSAPVAISRACGRG